MNSEQLSKGTILQQQIVQKKKDLSLWEYAVSFHTTIGSRDKQNNWIEPKTVHIPFDVVKTIVIDAYVKEIAKLEREFDLL